MAIGVLGEILLAMEDGVFDFTKDGKCTGCGKCCSNFLPMSDEEVKKIKRYMKNNNIHECKHLPPTRKVALDITCPFLNNDKENKRCEIYPVRPLICRVFCCNQPPSTVRFNRDEFCRTRKVHNMRDTFFRKDGCK